jgi:hypothetical protein
LDETERIAQKQKKPRKETPYDHELLSLETAYTGGQNFEYKVYSRKFPDTEQPVVRGEWTFVKNAIRRLLHVRNLMDLIRLDAKQAFQKHYKKFIRYEKIDQITHGLFILNQPSNSPRANARSLHRRGIVIAGPEKTSLFHCHTNEIRNATNLHKHYADEKKRIEEKLREGRPLTDFESRIKKLSPARLNKFFISLPDPFLPQEPDDPVE